MDRRNEFKSVLVQYLNDPCLEGISEKLLGLSVEIAPAVLIDTGSARLDILQSSKTRLYHSLRPLFSMTIRTMPSYRSIMSGSHICKQRL